MQPESIPDNVIPLAQGDGESGSPPPSDTGGAPAGGKGGRAGKTRQKRIDFGATERLTRHFALIYGTDTVWDGVNRIIMKVSHLRHAYGNDPVKLWLNSKLRRTIMPHHVVFDPTETCDPDTHVNLFAGMAMTPKAGNCQPLLQLLFHLCGGDCEEIPDVTDLPEAPGMASVEAIELMFWVLRWLAFPLQRPGAKMRTAMVVHGDEGSGKNLFFEAVRDIYGEYGSVIGQDQLENRFNDYLSKKLFIIGDEVITRQELRQHKGKLKALITGRETQIETKNMPLRTETNHVNVVFLSNELQPIELDNSDRRYCVIFTPPKRAQDFYKAIGTAVTHGAAREALYQYLLEVDLDGFTEHTPAPMTKAKTDLVDLGRKPPERFFIDWRNGFLPLPFHTCTTEQLYRGFKRWCGQSGERFPPNQNVFSRMLLRVSGGEVTGKVMKYDAPGKGAKAVRMFKVFDPPDGQSLQDWASGCVTAFEDRLREYLGHHEMPAA